VKLPSATRVLGIGGLVASLLLVWGIVQVAGIVMVVANVYALAKG
jgi:hypothetical protein